MRICECLLSALDSFHFTTHKSLVRTGSLLPGQYKVFLSPSSSNVVAGGKGFADGGAVFEGGNLEGVFDHVDVFTGHKQNEETNNGEDAGTVYIRTQTSAKAADEGHVKAGAG